jgi:hypothetical protein
VWQQFPLKTASKSSLCLGQQTDDSIHGSACISATMLLRGSVSATMLLRKQDSIALSKLLRFQNARSQENSGGRKAIRAGVEVQMYTWSIVLGIDCCNTGSGTVPVNHGGSSVVASSHPALAAVGLISTTTIG